MGIMSLSPQKLKFAILLLIAVAGVSVFHFAGLEKYMMPEQIRGALRSLGPMGPLFFVMIFSLGPTVFFPSWALTVAGGLAYGMVWGTVLSLIGASLGATIAFFVSRFLGRDFVGRILKGKFQRLDDRIGEHGFEVIFFLRLIPLVPFDALDYIAGVSKISVRSYIPATVLGIIPGTIVYVNFGSALTDMRSWRFAGAVTLLVLLAAAPILYRRWRGGTGTARKDEIVK
jgi:uncharacterized membrane protein YdjX (TVP38/TMEM64 family)